MERTKQNPCVCVCVRKIHRVWGVCVCVCLPVWVGVCDVFCITPSSRYIVNQSFCYSIIVTHPPWNRLDALRDIPSLIMQLELNEALDFISAPSIFLYTSSQM